MADNSDGSNNWKTFEVNENNCEVSWDGFSEKMNIKAHGSDNARFENEFIEEAPRRGRRNRYFE